jgi:hypothetical protein
LERENPDTPLRYFCTDDAFGDDVFGWLYWRAKGRSGQHMQILFWTIRPPRKEWLIVGAYQDATLATDDDLRKLDSFFRKKGVYKRRLAEALSAVERPDQKAYIKKHRPATAEYLRFKCPVGKVKLFQPYRVLPKRFQGKNIGARFKKVADTCRAPHIPTLHFRKAQFTPFNHPNELSVSVAGVPGVMELGLIEHVGARAGDGCTEQERPTVL